MPPSYDSLWLTSSRRSTFHKARKGALRSQNWPFPLTAAASRTSTVHPDHLARAGFYSTPTSDDPTVTTCFACDVVVGVWEEGEDPMARHVAAADEAQLDCPWASVQTASWEATGGLEGKDRETDWPRCWGDDGEMHPRGVAMERARKGTFAKGWPHHGEKGVPTADDIASAGWYFRPGSDDESADRCVCPYCIRTVEGWEAGDDPVALHNRKVGLGCPFFLAPLPTSAEPAGAKPKRGKKASTASSVASAAPAKGAKKTPAGRKGKKAVEEVEEAVEEEEEEQQAEGAHQEVEEVPAEAAIEEAVEADPQPRTRTTRSASVSTTVPAPVPVRQSRRAKATPAPSEDEVEPPVAAPALKKSTRSRTTTTVAATKPTRTRKADLDVSVSVEIASPPPPAPASASSTMRGAPAGTEDPPLISTGSSRSKAKTSVKPLAHALPTEIRDTDASPLVADESITDLAMIANAARELQPPSPTEDVAPAPIPAKAKSKAKTAKATSKSKGKSKSKATIADANDSQETEELQPPRPEIETASDAPITAPGPRPGQSAAASPTATRPIRSLPSKVNPSKSPSSTSLSAKAGPALPGPQGPPVPPVPAASLPPAPASPAPAPGANATARSSTYVPWATSTEPHEDDNPFAPHRIVSLLPPPTAHEMANLTVGQWYELVGQRVQAALEREMLEMQKGLEKRVDEGHARLEGMRREAQEREEREERAREDARRQRKADKVKASASKVAGSARKVR
ncbi:hypothetical protein JCM10212_006883 [Sporobolomyces blumeae]